MTFEVMPISALTDNYIWALVNHRNKQAVVVDPGEAQPVFKFLVDHGLFLSAILITHHHWDHTNGLDKLLEAYPVPVYGPENEKIPQITEPLHDGDVVNLKRVGAKFSVLEIPGHTLGHIAYYGEDIVFVGDTLFIAGCGRIFEGTVGQMYASLKKLANLPGETLVYCGHEYTLTNLRFARSLEPESTPLLKRFQAVEELRRYNKPSVPGTMAEELETNPFLRVDDPKFKKIVETKHGLPIETPEEVLAIIRTWKNLF